MEFWSLPSQVADALQLFCSFKWQLLASFCTMSVHYRWRYLPNTLMIWLLLSSAFSKMRAFRFSMLCHKELHKKVRVWPGQVIQTGQRDIPYHRMLCPVLKPEELPGRELIAAQWWHTVHHFFSSNLFLSLPPPIVTILLAFFVSIIKLFLTHKVYLFFPVLLPTMMGVEESDHTAAWYLIFGWD